MGIFVGRRPGLSSVRIRVGEFFVDAGRLEPRPNGGAARIRWMGRFAQAVGCFALFVMLGAPLVAQPSSVPSFRRGDANADASLDLADAVATFNWLFLGGEEPNCLDAADSNDDANIDLADGIFTLNFLFLGGRSIPSPGPNKCDVDPTPDDLGCRSYGPCVCGGIIGLRAPVTKRASYPPARASGRISRARAAPGPARVRGSFDPCAAAMG